MIRIGFITNPVTAVSGPVKRRRSRRSRRITTLATPSVLLRRKSPRPTTGRPRTRRSPVGGNFGTTVSPTGPARIARRPR
ncbi:hypothetical protein [Lysobacter gummosus]|uniref:hypothetical protein n=1 Tax=Lysobacter gummosus TaxID=262324 RepID=UPI00363687BA